MITVSTWIVFFVCQGCKDISGEWRSSDGQAETFTQNECAGSSSAGYTYSVSGSKATTDEGVTGAIGLAGITWSNGLSFISGKFLQIR